MFHANWPMTFAGAALVLVALGIFYGRGWFELWISAFATAVILMTRYELLPGWCTSWSWLQIAFSMGELPGGHSQIAYLNAALFPATPLLITTGFGALCLTIKERSWKKPQAPQFSLWRFLCLPLFIAVPLATSRLIEDPVGLPATYWSDLAVYWWKWQKVTPWNLYLEHGAGWGVMGLACYFAVYQTTRWWTRAAVLIATPVVLGTVQLFLNPWLNMLVPISGTYEFGGFSSWWRLMRTWLPLEIVLLSSLVALRLSLGAWHKLTARWQSGGVAETPVEPLG